MPRALEPNLSCPIILDFDKSKPQEEQPVIYTLALSMRKSRVLGDILDQLPNSKDTKELFDNLQTALSEVIYDWKNFYDPVTKEAIPFSKDKILDVFTVNEAYEVIRKVLSQGSVSREDEKKSE